MFQKKRTNKWNVRVLCTCMVDYNQFTLTITKNITFPDQNSDNFWLLIKFSFLFVRLLDIFYIYSFMVFTVSTPLYSSRCTWLTFTWIASNVWSNEYTSTMPSDNQWFLHRADGEIELVNEIKTKTKPNKVYKSSEFITNWTSKTMALSDIFILYLLDCIKFNVYLFFFFFFFFFSTYLNIQLSDVTVLFMLLLCHVLLYFLFNWYGWRGCECNGVFTINDIIVVWNIYSINEWIFWQMYKNGRHSHVLFFFSKEHDK